MGSETSYWCDRCGGTVEGLEYVDISRENASDSYPTRKHLGLCVECCERVLAAVDSVMAELGKVTA